MQCMKRPFALLLSAALLWNCSLSGVGAAEIQETLSADTVLPTETTEATEGTAEETTEETTSPTEETKAATEPEMTETEETYPEATVEETQLEETESAETHPEKTVEETQPEATEMSFLPELCAESELQMRNISRFGSRETPIAATAENSVATLGNSSGIKFRIFNYTNGKDADGNYITAGGINDNGLDGYFNFRGTSYENTGPDGKTVSNFTNSITDVDGYTANHATVLPNLGADGYPVFDGSRDGGPQRSLGYLFGAGGKGVTGYAPSNTLLRLNSRGQYYYNSADNAADFDTAGNRFIVRTYRERGKTTATMGTGQYYDFFPFTYWDGSTKGSTTNGGYNYENVQEVDYWYGMTMEASFSMPAGGLVQGDQMVFEFSGDDDVWVFIDGVLVLDLGGTHGVVSGSINFATGEVKQYLDWSGAGESSSGTSWPTTLKARFDAAGKAPAGGWNGDVFANYTEHSIKFYYLERATSCANCKILFNMPILPTGQLTVEKQVEGVRTALTDQEEYRFALVQQTASGERPAAGVDFDRIDVSDGRVLGTGTTESDGGFTLKAGQQAVFSLGAGKTYLVRETDPGPYAIPVGCTLNGTARPLATESGVASIDPEAPATVVFTNQLRTTSVTIRKLVAGNMGDRNQPFSFQVRVYAAPPASGGNILPGGGTVSIIHGQTQTLENIPVGAWVWVTEEGAEDYETVYQVGSLKGSGRVLQTGPVTEPMEILYTNTREVLIDTGIALDNVPYCWMTAAGMLLLRRRKKE